MSKLTTIKGFADHFSPDSSLFSFMEQTALRVFGLYGYKELRVPILEYTELFSRSIGTETDVVQKEMFTFPDRKGRSLTMRPEATAGIMRAYIESNSHAKEAISKFFTYGPMFRYERPQKGRMRQFHQLNCECLGASEPALDAEVIIMLMHFFGAIGLDNLALEVNTLGCAECRPVYKQTLQAFLEKIDEATLCEDCKRRLHTNPLRVLDCKVPSCKEQTKNAPNIGDHVCEPCAEHFGVVKTLLDAQDIPYVLNPRLVRGLDYYMRTTFEIVSNNIGSQGSVAGGGRYDGLVAQLGGPQVPGIGFGCGMERLAMLLQEKMAEQLTIRPDFYIACLDANAPKQAMEVAQVLRAAGLAGEFSFAAKSLKSQMRQASKNNARFCLLIGEEELAKKCVQVKNLDNGEQVAIDFAGLATWAQNAINSK